MNRIASSDVTSEVTGVESVRSPRLTRKPLVRPALTASPDRIVLVWCWSRSGRVSLEVLFESNHLDMTRIAVMNKDDGEYRNNVLAGRL